MNKQKKNKVFFSLTVVILTAVLQYVNLFYSQSLPYFAILATSLGAGLIKYLEGSNQRDKIIYIRPTPKKRKRRYKSKR